MGFVTYEMELISIVSPTKLFSAIVLEAGDFLPKIFPQLIASFITIEGDGGPGTIKQINYVDGNLTLQIQWHLLLRILGGFNNLIYFREVCEGEDRCDRQGEFHVCLFSD